MEPPSFLVRLLHSVPHLNISFQRVNDTFNLASDTYVESLGILAFIPAGLLILFLIGLLIYLLTRCCDRKPHEASLQTCQRCTLIVTTLFCCAAIGLGLYGNDDLHNGLLQTFGSIKQIENLIVTFKDKTEKLKHNIQTRVLMSDLDDMVDGPTQNQTAVNIILDTIVLVKENTTRAVSALEAVLYLIRPLEQDSLRVILQPAELYEAIRWPVSLGFLTVLLLLCTILVIGVARQSRCALIFFSVFGLVGVILCWLLSGVYLASSVALGDFCMRPNEFICRQVALHRRHDVVNYLNCGNLRNRFILRLNESRDNIDRARDMLQLLSRISKEVYPKGSVISSVEKINREFSDTRQQLLVLSSMLDKRSVDKYYFNAIRGVCSGGLLGLSLMMMASLLTAFLLTILVCVDSHTWIYLTKKYTYADKSETTPFFPFGSSSSPLAPTAPTSMTGTTTSNKSLNQSQPNNMGTTVRNGIAPMRTAAISSGHQTLNRLPSHHQSSYQSESNVDKYATWNKHNKPLSSNEFY